MKSLLVLAVLCLTLALVSCKENANEPVAAGDDAATVAWYNAIDAEIASADTADTNRNFIAILSGRDEVPARPSRGRGVAKFKVSLDGQSIHFKLIVANISNVVAAHIHKAAKGEIGPVLFGLYDAAPGGGRIQGPIAEGDFTAAELGMPFDLFLADLHSDSLYVNVHTNDGVAPPNTGKGDFPSGEIRGQLR
jgi:hypothetical protein